jgi:hypothetical protein
MKDWMSMAAAAVVGTAPVVVAADGDFTVVAGGDGVAGVGAQALGDPLRAGASPPDAAGAIEAEGGDGDVGHGAESARAVAADY